MNVSPISSASNNSFLTPNNNDVIKVLEKQKANLQEQIQKTNESKMDDKLKQERIKQLQEQIQQIDTEIKQKQVEKLNQSKNNQQQPVNPSNTVNSANDPETGSSLSGMTELVQAGSAYSNAKQISNIKNNIHNKGQILKKEIELDESRSKSGSKAALKRTELQDIESRQKMLDKKAAESNQEVQKQVKNASKGNGKSQNIQKNSEVEKKDSDNIGKKQTGGNPQENTQQAVPDKTSKRYTKIDVKI